MLLLIEGQLKDGSLGFPLFIDIISVHFIFNYYTTWFLLISGFIWVFTFLKLFFFLIFLFF